MLSIDYKDEELVRWLLLNLQSDGRYHLIDIIRPDEELPRTALYLECNTINSEGYMRVGGDIKNTDKIKVTPLNPRFELYAAMIEPLSFDPKRIRFITSYSQMAKHWSQHSYCVRRKVGALIVKDNAIISDGFNGTPSGFENCCEIEVKQTVVREHAGALGESLIDFDHKVLKTRPEVLHAESNALMKCARMGRATDGADLYVSTSPCIECSKLIIQAGIKRVFFSELYKDVSGVLLLLKSGIEVYYFPITGSI